MNININLKEAKFKKTNFAWQFGIGNDHAYQMLRRDMFEHIKLIHDEIGFKYIRFHGIFDDDMLTYQRLSDFRQMSGLPGARNIKELNFRHCGSVYHNVLDAGFKPFVELSFMPEILAKGKKTGLRYKNNTCMPKFLMEWGEYIQCFIKYLTHEFSKEEIETWYFEVWNEPDLNGFFSGSKEDYFKLYETTARAIKEINPNLKVGGPSTSACKWIKEFREYVESNHIPCDFISSHHYPGDAFGNMITFKTAMGMMKSSRKNAKKGVGLSRSIQDFFFHPEICKTWGKDGFRTMDKKALDESGNLPFIITEYNSMAVFGSPCHDEKYSAAFIIKSCLDLNENVFGTSFWCGSDLFEEQFMLPKPFVGSFGMVSNDGIPKPNFYAFKMLSMLYGEALVKDVSDGDIEYGVFKDGNGNVQLLVYSQDFDYYKNESHSINIIIDDTFSKCSIARIDDNHTNPKKLWVEMGSQDNLNKNEVKDIIEKSRLSFENYPMKNSGSKTLIGIELKTNDVVMISLTK